jgi:ribosomal protein S18 acetylase RimI-like enzyme
MNNYQIKQEAVVNNLFSENGLKNFLFLEEKCIPIEWQYGEDAEKYYREKLSDKKNIVVFLMEDNRAVGCLLALPMDDAFMCDIKEYDLHVKKNDHRMYIETIQILPESRGMGGSKKMILSMCEESKRRNIEKFAAHARKINGFSEMIKRMFKGGITLIRKIEKWDPAGGEPYEYIEWKIK